MKSNLQADIGNLLIASMLQRMQQNTPTESNTVSQAGQDTAGAEAKLSKSTRLADSSQRRGIQQVSEVTQ